MLIELLHEWIDSHMEMPVPILTENGHLLLAEK